MTPCHKVNEMHHLARAQSHSCPALLGSSYATSRKMQRQLNMMLVMVVWLPSHDTWQFVLQSAKDHNYMCASAATTCLSQAKLTAAQMTLNAAHMMLNAAHKILNQPHGHKHQSNNREGKYLLWEWVVLGHHWGSGTTPWGLLHGWSRQ